MPLYTAGGENRPQSRNSIYSDIIALVPRALGGGLNAEPTNDGSIPDVQTRDFGFLPIPMGARCDPTQPPRFGLSLNILFAVASTFTTANLYYSVPFLLKIADTFGTTEKEVASIPSLMLAGYALGVFFVAPLGDLVRRRPLILALCFISAMLTIALATAQSLPVFQLFCFFIGLSTVVPQILMPLATDLAPPERRASALSIVLSGLLCGILVSRVLGGIVAEFVVWRIVYVIAIFVQFIVLGLLYWKLPDYPAKNPEATYWQILYSMAKYAVTEPLLVQAIIMTVPSAATFTNWWVTLTFLLAGEPYNFSTLAIGMFGFIGLTGVICAPLIGRIIDRVLLPWTATLIAILGLILTFAIQTAAAGTSLVAVILVCLLLDVFRQSQQTSLTVAVLALDPRARSRINAVLLLALFLGQTMGTSVGAELFTRHGWQANAAFNLACTLFSLAVLLARGPHCKRYTWLGWEGGLELRRSRVEAVKRAAEERDPTRRWSGETTIVEMVTTPEEADGVDKKKPQLTVHERAAGTEADAVGLAV
ncbi:major facilitator superfamily domain-containing protein [Epithele typhae]|uniref:major facilitator superfamily domain-containing protein n=1 Tax=Epithele typhae TaxID=378194 RepID=UPI002008EA1E|nr:major facilitator superfamily domain-containing protein [Epithele typhae]KAH9919184.1 major facilitator superfamily domain-containing protein [Epithele typhae]